MASFDFINEQVSAVANEPAQRGTSL